VNPNKEQTLTKGQVARAIRYKARNRLREYTSLPRVKACGRVAHSDIAVNYVEAKGDQKSAAGMSGFVTCGSTWACPQCSAVIAERRRQDLHELMVKHRNAGGRFSLLTLTLRHHKRNSLKDVWRKLMTAWKYFQSGRYWKEARGIFVGYARVVEVTHGKNGWHVHIHVVFFHKKTVLSTKEFDRQVSVNRDRWSERWQAALGRVGATADKTAGVDYRPLKGNVADTLGEYFVKATYEIARADMKDARMGNRTPFAILKGFLMQGDLDDAAIWAEFERESHGKRQWGFSRGLKEVYRVKEVEDEEIVSESFGEPLILIEARAAGSAQNFAKRDHCLLLEAAERAGSWESARSAVVAVLEGWGVGYRYPPVLGERV